MALHVPAVLQAQRLEFVVGQFAIEVAAQLVAELRGAGAHELAVEFGVLVHGRRVEACSPGLKDAQSRNRPYI